MAQPKYDGVAVTIDGRDFIVPPLCLRDLKRLLPKMDGIESLSPIQACDVLVEIIQAALARNYPEITTDELDGMLDPQNLNTLAERVMEASGLKKKAQPEPAMMMSSTGTVFTLP